MCRFLCVCGLNSSRNRGTILTNCLIETIRNLCKKHLKSLGGLCVNKKTTVPFRGTDEQKRKLNQEQYFDLGKLPEETLRKEFEKYIREA